MAVCLKGLVSASRLPRQTRSSEVYRAPCEDCLRSVHTRQMHLSRAAYLLVFVCLPSSPSAHGNAVQKASRTDACVHFGNNVRCAFLFERDSEFKQSKDVLPAACSCFVLGYEFNVEKKHVDAECDFILVFLKDDCLNMLVLHNNTI